MLDMFQDVEAWTRMREAKLHIIETVQALRAEYTFVASTGYPTSIRIGPAALSSRSFSSWGVLPEINRRSTEVSDFKPGRGIQEFRGKPFVIFRSSQLACATALAAYVASPQSRPKLILADNDADLEHILVMISKLEYSKSGDNFILIMKQNEDETEAGQLEFVESVAAIR